MDLDELHRYREFAQKAPARGPEARAAVAALVASREERIADWWALYDLAGARGRWDEALEIGRAAVRRYPGSANAALMVPAALAELKRHEEAQRGFEAVAAAFPDDFDALDRLVSIAWNLGNFLGAIEYVEETLTRGLHNRDHIVQMGTSSATLTGQFDRARRLSEHIVNVDLRRSTLDKIRIAEEEWTTAAAALEAHYGGEISVHSIDRMLEKEQHDLTRHAAVRLLMQTESPSDLEFLIHRTNPLGPSGWFLSQWARHKGRHEFPDHPAFLWGEAGLRLQHGAFEAAGRLLLKLVDSNADPEFLLRWLAFAAAGGGLSHDQLLEAATRVVGPGSREGAYQLVLSFLHRHQSPGALDHMEGTAGEKGAENARLRLPTAPGHQLRRFYIPPRLRKPRVAVCIAGQLRSYRQTWPGSRTALSDCDTTVFVSTWENTGLAFGVHDSADRLLPVSVQQRLPLSMRRRTTFEGCLPRVFSAMTRTSSVSRDELVEFFGTPFVRVHDEALFESRHCEDRPGLRHLDTYNQAKMFFTITDANSMKSAFELENGLIFDAVLRLRPDRELTSLGDGDLERVMGTRSLLSDYLHPGGVGDQFLLSSSEVADIYGDIWPCLDAWGSPDYFPGASGLFAENLVAEHVIAHGVEVGVFSSTHAHWLSAESVPLSALWTAVGEELSGPARPDLETRAILSAFCEAVAERAGSELQTYARPDSADLRRWGLFDRLSDRAKAFIEG